MNFPAIEKIKTNMSQADLLEIVEGLEMYGDEFSFSPSMRFEGYAEFKFSWRADTYRLNTENDMVVSINRL